MNICCKLLLLTNILFLGLVLPSVAAESSKGLYKKLPEKKLEKPSDKTGDNIGKTPDKNSASKSSVQEPVIENVIQVVPEDLVARPHEFLGKNVKFLANFFAFSNLALDYKPAYRSSKTHLSLLVEHSKSHIPLAELKLAMMIPKEKDPETNLLATLKEGEPLEIVGKVFNAALDEPWVEVLKIKKLNTEEKKDEKKETAQGTDSKVKNNEVKSEKLNDENSKHTKGTN